MTFGGQSLSTSRREMLGRIAASGAVAAVGLPVSVGAKPAKPAGLLALWHERQQLCADFDAAPDDVQYDGEDHFNERICEIDNSILETAAVTSDDFYAKIALVRNQLQPNTRYFQGQLLESLLSDVERLARKGAWA